MNQKQIVLEHRNALDAFEEAKSKYNGCARAGNCKDEKYCLTCPARLEKEHCAVILQEKSDALQKLNDHIIERNEEEALQMRIDRLNARKARATPKSIIIERTKRTPKAIVKLKSTKKVREQESMEVEVKQEAANKRNELTLERYLQHRDDEGKIDREIREMYDIPRGSFGKIKKDLLAQLEPTENESVEVTATVEVEKVPLVKLKDGIEPKASLVTLKSQVAEQVEDSDVALRRKVTELKRDYDVVVDQLKQATDINVKLEQRVIAANNQLTQEQQFSNELKDMVDFLENKLKEQLPVEQNETSVEQDKVNYKELYEETLEKLDATGDLAENYLQEIEQLQAKFNELVHSSNKQIHKVKDYEITLLERLLQELYANRN